MRHHEFELTEDELFELKMSPTNLSKMAKNIDARVGMEFELIVPGFRDEDQEYETEPDYDMDESFPTGPGWQRDVIAFFTGGDYGESRSYIQRKIDQLNEDFYDWVGEQQEEYMASSEGQRRALEIATGNVNRDDYETDEEYESAVSEYLTDNEDDIRDELIDEYNDDLDSKFEEWLDDQGINSMMDFHNEYEVAWPYYTEPYYNESSVSIDQIADDFSQATGYPVNASSSYHGATRQPGRYVVEPDSSLHGDDGDAGLEFVSPPMPVNQMLNDIDAVAKWAGRVGAYTNESTGLHMNVSVPNQQKLDFVKLAMFLGDNYILEQFGREGNSYCKSILKQIVLTARSDPSRVEEMMRQFQGGLNQLASKVLHTGSTSKYSSINNRGGWIEFRGPGGDWLGDDLSAVKNTMLRAVVALDVATKPDEFKQEYYKKLYKTLSQGQDNDTIQYFAKYAAGELPQSALKAFVRQIQGKRKAEKLAMGAKDILLVWKVIGDQNDPVQSQGIEVLAQDQLGAYKEAIKKWNIVTQGAESGLSIEGWAERHNWKAKPLRAATTADMNLASNKFYRVAVGGRPDKKVYVRAMSEYQAKTLAVQRHADVFANVTFDDMVAIHDPDYQGEETAISAMRARSGAPVPAGAVGGEQSSDANYEIYNGETDRVMFRFIANTDEEARRKFDDWITSANLNRAGFGWRRIENRGIPGSTAELARQRAEQTPSRDQEFTGVWEIVSRNTNEVVSVISGIGNAVADAERHAARWQQQTGFDDPVYVRPLMRARDNLPRNQGEPTQARGSESLPPGNARWRIYDTNGDEVHSFINTTAQSDANQYARNWMINSAPVEIRNRGPFNIVPDTR